MGNLLGPDVRQPEVAEKPTLQAVPLVTFSVELGPYCGGCFVRGLSTVRIPVKWSTDSGDVGRSRSEATLVVFYVSKVDHMRSRKA
jgi:hypothetical protein